MTELPLFSLSIMISDCRHWNAFEEETSFVDRLESDAYYAANLQLVVNYGVSKTDPVRVWKDKTFVEESTELATNGDTEATQHSGHEHSDTRVPVPCSSPKFEVKCLVLYYH